MSDATLLAVFQIAVVTEAPFDTEEDQAARTAEVVALLKRLTADLAAIRADFPHLIITEVMLA